MPSAFVLCTNEIGFLVFKESVGLSCDEHDKDSEDKCKRIHNKKINDGGKFAAENQAYRPSPDHSAAERCEGEACGQEPGFSHALFTELFKEEERQESRAVTDAVDDELLGGSARSDAKRQTADNGVDSRPAAPSHHHDADDRDSGREGKQLQREPF